jgi:hypothetical protein
LIGKLQVSSEKRVASERARKCSVGEEPQNSSVTQMAEARPAKLKLMSGIELQNQSFASSPLEAK